VESVAFFAGALGAVGGAVAVIALRNPFYSVLALVVHLVSLAGLFLLLHAEFVAAAQVVVYAGAVMVLYVFVAAYVGGVEEPMWEPIPGQRILAPLMAAAGVGPEVAGAALVLGASFGGDLLNPGAQDVQTLAGVTGLSAPAISARVIPAGIAGALVAAIVFAVLLRPARSRTGGYGDRG